MDQGLRDFYFLSDFLKEENIIIWKEPALKEEVLRDLTRAVQTNDEDFNSIYQRLLVREKESSTFFNEGVAFPHLRLEGDLSTIIALGIIPQGIANLATTIPVRLVFLILSSLQHIEIQSKLLAIASRIARNNQLVNKLFANKTPEKILREIRNWEHS